MSRGRKVVITTIDSLTLMDIGTQVYIDLKRRRAQKGSEITETITYQLKQGAVGGEISSPMGLLAQFGKIPYSALIPRMILNLGITCAHLQEKMTLTRRTISCVFPPPQLQTH